MREHAARGSADSNVRDAVRGRGKCCGAGAAQVGQGAGARIPICAIARAREVLRRRGCASWTGRGSADSNMRGCAGAGSDVVCGKRGKTGGGWLYRAVRRFHPIDRKSLKNRSELCCFGVLTPSTGEFFKSLGGIHLDRASARSAAVCSERESTAAAGCIER